MDVREIFGKVSTIEAMIYIAIENGNLKGDIGNSLSTVTKELRMYLYDRLSEYYN